LGSDSGSGPPAPQRRPRDARHRAGRKDQQPLRPQHHAGPPEPEEGLHEDGREPHDYVFSQAAPVVPVPVAVAVPVPVAVAVAVPVSVAVAVAVPVSLAVAVAVPVSVAVAVAVPVAVAVAVAVPVAVPGPCARV
jgi:hypothetical protein